MTEFLYHYKMTVTRVVDGDTIRGDVDLGFGFIQKNQEFRFTGINAPEIHGPSSAEGMKAKQYVSDLITGKDIVIVTKKDGKEKWGRFLAEIFYLDTTGNYVSLNKELVAKGLAIPFMV
jgi:endonuclease YncB( thermonuclease family)